MTHVQYVHKMVDVWQVEYVEKIVEVPKVVIQEIEKVVEVPQVKRVETVVVKILEEYGDDLTVVRRGGGYLHGYQVLTPDRGSTSASPDRAEIWKWNENFFRGLGVF